MKQYLLTSTLTDVSFLEPQVATYLVIFEIQFQPLSQLAHFSSPQNIQEFDNIFHKQMIQALDLNLQGQTHLE